MSWSSFGATFVTTPECHSKRWYARALYAQDKSLHRVPRYLGAIAHPSYRASLPDILGWSIWHNLPGQLPDQSVLLCLVTTSHKQANIATTDNFTVRSRALASFLSAVVGLAANLSTGALLDLKFSAAVKSRAIYLGIAVVVTAAWIWNAVIEVNISSRSTSPALDLNSGAFFNSAFAVYIVFKFFYEAMQTYIYWFMGAKKGTHKNGEVARMTGIMRSWESIGSAVAYGIGASSVSNRNQMIIAFALWIFTIPPTLMVVFGRWDLARDTKDSDMGDESETSSDSEVQTSVVVSGEPKV